MTARVREPVNPNWERVYSPADYRRVVYWGLTISPFLRVAVTKQGRVFTWQVFDRTDERRAWRKTESGSARALVTAQRHGQVAARLGPLCPHGCGHLQWVDDQWYCPVCEDEWEDEILYPQAT